MGGGYSIQIVKDQVAAIKALMHDVLKADQHYGKIPGVAKESLYKPGAEKINFMFRIGTGEPIIKETDLAMTTANMR